MRAVQADLVDAAGLATAVDGVRAALMHAQPTRENAGAGTSERVPLICSEAMVSRPRARMYGIAYMRTSPCTSLQSPVGSSSVACCRVRHERVCRPAHSARARQEGLGSARGLCALPALHVLTACLCTPPARTADNESAC